MTQAKGIDWAEEGRADLVSSECSLGRDLALCALDDLRLFAATLEELIERESKRIAERHSDPAEDYEGWWIEDIVARQLRNSFVAACMDVTAYHLTLLSRDVAAILRQPMPDLRSVVSDARRFLQSAEFGKPKPSTWDRVLGLYKFRNIVVHSSAVTDDDTARKLAHLLRSAPGITENLRSYDIDRFFCQYVHSTISLFFEELHEELTDLCRRSAHLV